MGKTARILVLGVGNPLYGDDGVGIRALRDLGGIALPDGVDLKDGATRGVDLIYLMQDYDRVVVVDAVRYDHGGGARLMDFDIEDVNLRPTELSFSLHQMNLGGAVRLAQVLGEPLPPIRVFGITPEKEGPGEGLSVGCEALMEDLVDKIRKYLEKVAAEAA